jgi:DtxR family Mn-dependent transcriptional regulator
MNGRTLPTISRAAESYLEAIYNMLDEGKIVIAARLAERMDLKPPTVSGMLRRMSQAGLVVVAADHSISLTEAGVRVAEAITRRHRMLERFLTDYLGLSWHESHEEADRLQHAISERVEAALMVALGHPQACPHGNPIPGMGAPRLPDGALTLDRASKGQRLMIDRITEEGERNLELLGYLEERGVIPRQVLTVADHSQWNETVSLEGVSGRATLGFRAARTIWAHPVE